MDGVSIVELWAELLLMTKVGLIAQAIACGLVGAASRRPSRGLLVAALIACVIGLLGATIIPIGELEYVRCAGGDPFLK